MQNPYQKKDELEFEYVGIIEIDLSGFPKMDEEEVRMLKVDLRRHLEEYVSGYERGKIGVRRFNVGKVKWR